MNTTLRLLQTLNTWLTHGGKKALNSKLLLNKEENAF